MNAAATRRTLLRGLLAGLAGRYCVRRSSAALLPETGAAPRALLHGFRSGQAVERRYRADAAVIFCGVTIFSRRDVGGAYASVETGQAGGASATALRSSAHQQVTFARGSASRGSARSWTELIPLSRPCDWKESPDLLAALADEEPRSPAREISAGAGPFLSTMRAAALSEQSASQRPFVHAGKLFALELKRRESNAYEGAIHS